MKPCAVKGGIVLLLSLALFSSGTDAQILNTLRGWKDLESGWSAEAEGRFSFSRGNMEHVILSAGGAVQLIEGGHRVRFMLAESYHSVDGERVAEDFRVHLRHNYGLTELLSTLLFAQNQTNPFQRLHRRMLLGGGLRADLIRTDLCSAALGASVMLESIMLTDDPDGEYDQNSRCSFFLSVLWNPVHYLSVDISGFYQPLLPGLSEPLMMTALRLETEVTEALALFSSLDISYNSYPPAGVEKTDMALSSGLRISL